LQFFKTKDKKTFGVHLYRLNERWNLYSAHEEKHIQLSFEQRFQIEALLQTGRN